MKDKLYPLLFKSGIKRDGTPFQGEYCTEGQWVRWQRGNVRKIGGMLAVCPHMQESTISTFYLSKQDKTTWAYIINNQGFFIQQINNDLHVQTIDITPINNFPNLNTNLCQIIPITISGTASILVFFGTNSLSDINSSNPGILYSVPLYSEQRATKVNIIDQPLGENSIAPIIPSGGVIYTSNYLFIYGSNGTVLCSAREAIDNTPSIFNFSNLTNVDKGGVRIQISTDKVIYGCVIRGGNETPTLLFWSLSSVVRVTNVSNQSTFSKILFRSDVISNSTSIMSSRSVVEYEGLLFWMGAKTFYVYNGQITNVVNIMNNNFVFNNIDMNKRQQVFGILNVEFKEIWWFYPEKENKGNANIGCTRAVIYNVAEDCWYDTAISRDSGMLFETNGKIYTIGKSLADPLNDNSYLFQHEVGTDEVIYTPNAVQQPIISSFITPIFSWASFSPLKGTDGIDRNIQLKRIEPDMKMNVGEAANVLSLTINTRAYAQSPRYSYKPIPFTGETSKIDYYAQGRQMSFTISSTSFFEMGHWFMLLNVGDGRP